jgi:hypothetical protein
MMGCSPAPHRPPARRAATIALVLSRSSSNGTFVKGWIYRDQLHPAGELDSAGNLLKRFVYASGKLT